MEKTEFEIRESVLAHCTHLLGEIQVEGKKPYPEYPDISCFIDDGVIANYTVWPFGDHSSFFIIIYTDRAVVDDQWKKAYRLLGLDKRDALEAERAFWTASTDSLTKSLEAEKVKNANGGEFKDMLQQVLNHSNRPEMDDAQFRMFARENINYLLYGNKEGKKDE